MHLAFLQPTQKEKFEAAAHNHYSAALPSFRAGLGDLQREDSCIVYGCAQLVAKYTTAIESHPETVLFSPNASAVGNWVLLHCGAYLVRDMNKAAIQQTSAACFAIDYFDLISAPLPDFYDDGLNRLSRLLADLPEEPRGVYTSVVNLLRRLFAHENDISSEANSKAVLLAAVAKIPTAFLLAVQQAEPRAVVILAHFCIMFEKLNNDHFWYMKNWSRLIFEECNRRLDSSWKRHLAWPRSFLSSNL